MKTFSLPAGTQVTINSLNVRSEKHGKSRVPAVDVRCSLKAPNTVLDQLNPTLRRALYTEAHDGTPEAQQDLEGVDAVSETPLLRVSNLEPVRITDELTGYDATFTLGTGRKESNVELSGAKVNGFVVEAMQGGTVRIDFRLQAAHIQKREIGELGVLIDHEVGLTLAPSESQQQTLDDAEPKPLSKTQQKMAAAAERAAGKVH